MHFHSRAFLAFASGFGLALLSGCAASFVPTTAGIEAAISPFQGNVHGGQQPVAGAHVYVMEAVTTGYGAASKSLIASNYDGTDSVGKYVLTNASGGFSITSAVPCDSNSQVYLLAEQGNPGLTATVNNTAIALMAALGPCSGNGTVVPAVPSVNINEVSTVVTAYALAGFATDALHISSSASALAVQGLANAFAAVPNIMNIATGTPLTTTAAGSNGVVPLAEINTLANVLASCINSSGPTQGGCPTLFANATLNGASGGTQPTETATAAINIAHHPAQSPTSIYNLQSSSPVFAPNLPSAPNDFTIKLYYTGGGIQSSAGVAVDGSGNVWTAGNNTLSKLSPLGAALSGTSGFTGGGLNFCLGVAIDTSGNAWVANEMGNNVSKFNSSGVSQAGSTGFTGNGDLNPSQLAFDTGGNLWVTNTGKGTVSKLTPSGSEVLNASDQGYLSAPTGIAIDGNNNVWTTDTASGGQFLRVGSNSTGVELNNHDYDGCNNYGCRFVAITSGSASAWVANNNNTVGFQTPNSSGGSSTYYTGGGLSKSTDLVLDGAGNFWVTNFNNTVSEFNSSGTALSPATGFTTALGATYGIAVDGSGNVWVSDNSGTQMAEFLGAAIPTVTPLVQAAINNNLAGRP